MPVFVSYFRADEESAKRVNQHLIQRGIRTYFDKLDATITLSENVTQSILKGLENCTHLLAVVSETTFRSWWVPFEIGAATRGERRITTYAFSPTQLPDYLTIWPVLSSLGGLDSFITRYLQDALSLKSLNRANEARTASIQTPEDFHKALKRDLGQR